MTLRKPSRPVKQSTYSLLVRSNEKRHGYLETVVYALILVSAVAAILQFSLQPDPLPLRCLPSSAEPA
jgi:hypothetical protein